MIRTRKLTTIQEMIEFKSRYRERSGFDVCEYFMMGKSVYAFLDVKGEMVGGFITGSGPDLRVIQGSSPEAISAVINHVGSLENTTEIGMAWLSGKYRGNILASAIFWSRAVRLVMRSEQNFFVCSAIPPGLKKLYEECGFVKVWSGPSSDGEEDYFVGVPGDLGRAFAKGAIYKIRRKARKSLSTLLKAS